MLNFAAVQTRRLADLAAAWPLGATVRHTDSGLTGTVTADHPSSIPGTWEPARPWVALVGSGGYVCAQWFRDGFTWTAWINASYLEPGGRPPRQRTRAHQPVNRGR